MQLYKGKKKEKEERRKKKDKEGWKEKENVNAIYLSIIMLSFESLQLYT